MAGQGRDIHPAPGTPLPGEAGQGAGQGHDPPDAIGPPRLVRAVRVPGEQPARAAGPVQPCGNGIGLRATELRNFRVAQPADAGEARRTREARSWQI